MKQPKVALFYDWINQWGGAEKVLLNLIKIFPKAPIFTLVYNPKKTKWLPKEVKIHPSFIQKLPLAYKNNLLYTPFYSIALEQFDFSKFDIVISTTSISGHSLLTQPKTMFVCYFHNTNRYVYQTPKQFRYLRPLLNHYQKSDFIFAQRPDYLLCNSKTVQQRIKDHYQRPSTVLYPGVNTDFFKPSTDKKNKEKYFLVVSRLVSHKRIDIAIKACHRLNLKLIIVGTGRDKAKLTQIKKRLNDQNITFLGKVSSHHLLELYQNCQALICPQVEDFGLTPIEAQACGKPVIALKKGGITETVISGKTGIFFKRQTVKSCVQALKKFSSKKFKGGDCVAHASKFSDKIFMLHFKQIVNQLWQHHQTTT